MNTEAKQWLAVAAGLAESTGMIPPFEKTKNTVDIIKYKQGEYKDLLPRVGKKPKKHNKKRRGY